MTKPATILYLHSSDDLYGADFILLQTVTNLDRERFIPLVVLPADMKHVGLLSRELTAAGVEWIHLPIAIMRRRYLKPSGILPFLKSVLIGTWALKRLVRERDVKIIHGFTFAVVASPLLNWCVNVPLVMHCHEILQRPLLLRKTLHALAVRWASRIICVSNPVRANILEDQPAAAGRIRVLHNGIPAPPAATRTVAAMRSELGIPVERPLVGMIGRVSPWKGQRVFLEAASLVLKHDRNCHFIAIGGVFDNETRHLDRIRELHSALNLQDKVTLCDFRKDARDLLSAFDVFVLPSTSPDPFPTVVLEAMAAGVPVIATAHGGPVDMVIEGQTGNLVPPADPLALANAIAALLAAPDRRLRMGAAGKARMLSCFELARYVRDIHQLYEEVLGEKCA